MCSCTPHKNRRRDACAAVTEREFLTGEKLPLSHKRALGMVQGGGQQTKDERMMIDEDGSHAALVRAHRGATQAEK